MIRSTFLILAAMAAIVLLEITALRQGIDGKCLTLSVALLAGLAGYQLPRIGRGIKNANKKDDRVKNV